MNLNIEKQKSAMSSKFTNTEPPKGIENMKRYPPVRNWKERGKWKINFTYLTK